MEKGLVKKKLKDNKVSIEVMVSEGCASCAEKDHCSIGDNKQIITAIDEIGVQEGDWVAFEINEKNKIILAAVFFLFPVIGLVGGYFFGDFLRGLYEKDWVLPVTTILCLLSSIGLIKLITLFLEKNKEFYPKVIEKI